MWTLQTDLGFVLLSSGEQELVPVWPHRRFALACTDAEWVGAVPVAIPLDRWLEAWTAGMARDERAVAVFPVPSGQGVVVEPNQLAGDLVEECEHYD